MAIAILTCRLFFMVRTTSSTALTLSMLSLMKSLMPFDRQFSLISPDSTI